MTAPFQFSPTGTVRIGNRDYTWDKLGAATQGYLEEAAQWFWEELRLHPAGDVAEAMAHLGHTVEFSDFSAEAVEAAIWDCSTYQVAWNAVLSADAGRRFFSDRQLGIIADFPPVSVRIGGDGKLGFGEGSLSGPPRANQGTTPDGAAPIAQPSAAFTPGPWALLNDPSSGRPDRIRLVSSNCNADGSERSGPSKNGGMMVAHTLGPDAVANAQLIAAAPDLYEALTRAERWFRDYERQHRAKGTLDGNLKADTNEERADYLRAALAKAAPADAAPQSAVTAHAPRDENQ